LSQLYVLPIYNVIVSDEFDCIKYIMWQYILVIIVTSMLMKILVIPFLGGVAAEDDAV